MSNWVTYRHKYTHLLTIKHAFNWFFLRSTLFSLSGSTRHFSPTNSSCLKGFSYAAYYPLKNACHIFLLCTKCTNCPCSKRTSLISISGRPTRLIPSTWDFTLSSVFFHHSSSPSDPTILVFSCKPFQENLIYPPNSYPLHSSLDISSLGGI